jgi:hypothetical protein
MSFKPSTLAKIKRLRADYREFARTNLKVKTKSGKLVPFIFNKAQDYIHERLEEQKAEHGFVRALILKGRQQGASTYIGGRFYHRTALNRGLNAFILTHEQEATNNLFAMVERYHEHNPLRPNTGAANAKELFFDRLDSGYTVGTAGTKAVGRSKTIMLLHGSEAAFWPHAATHFAGVVQAVPLEPGSEVILESTANGVGGEFHERWQQAERGEGDYIAIFVPWFWQDEYRRPVPEGFTPDAEERAYMELHGLDLGQVVWMRAKRAELKDPLLFKQEYPATPDEAFQTTGHDSFISAERVLAARKNDVEGIGALVIGADPARKGADDFAIIRRKGRKAFGLERKQKLDVVQGANWLESVLKADKPAKMFIDVGGLGAGVYDILNDRGYGDVIEAVNFGGSPEEPDILLTLPGGESEKRPGPLNRRAEMYMRGRDWLADPAGVDLPDDNSLQADLCGPGYTYNNNQNLVIESKEAMRKRGLKSPDGGDALILTFASTVAPPDAYDGSFYGSGSSRSSGWMAS